MAKEFSYEIVKPVAVLSKSKDGKYTTELNYISYGGGAAKLDLRRWNREKNIMLKGLTLTADEAKALKSVLEEMA